VGWSAAIVRLQPVRWPTLSTLTLTRDRRAVAALADRNSRAAAGGRVKYAARWRPAPKGDDHHASYPGHRHRPAAGQCRPGRLSDQPGRPGRDPSPAASGRHRSPGNQGPGPCRWGPTATPPSPQPPTPKPPVTQDPVCVGARSWGTGPKRVVASPIGAEIDQVRAATHDGCDRVVFDLNGLGRVGYLVRYVPVVHADPSDQPIPVAGGTALQVTVQASDFRESGHQSWRMPRRLDQRLVGGQTVVREVRFAGAFEHVTTFASACVPNGPSGCWSCRRRQPHHPGSWSASRTSPRLAHTWSGTIRRVGVSYRPRPATCWLSVHSCCAERS
jgi:hypothetical protein